MDKLEEYVKRMVLKRAVTGGLDEEDVRHHIDEICSMARKENAVLREQLRESWDELEEIKGNPKFCHVAGVDKGNKTADPNRMEIRKIQQAYDEKCHELIVAVDALQQAMQEAKEIVRREMREEREREAEKVRACLREEIRTKRHAAEQEVKEITKDVGNMKKEVEELEKRKHALIEAIGREQEQWKMLIGRIIRQLGLRKTDFTDQEADFLNMEDAEDFTDKEFGLLRSDENGAVPESGPEAWGLGTDLSGSPEQEPEGQQETTPIDSEDPFQKL